MKNIQNLISGWILLTEEQRYNFVYCVHCRYDVEEQEGYLEAKHWDFCPYCGNKLVRRPHAEVPRWTGEEDGISKVKGVKI